MESQNQNLDQNLASVLQSARRQTPNRQEILEILERAKGPLAAAEIHRLARRKRPHMGLATIYRTLKMMQDENRVRFVNLPGHGLIEIARANALRSRAT